MSYLKKSVIGAWDITNVAWSEKEYSSLGAAANVKLPDDKCILSTFADVQNRMTTLLEQSSEQPKEYSFCQKIGARITNNWYSKFNFLCQKSVT